MGFYKNTDEPHLKLLGVQTSWVDRQRGGRVRRHGPEPRVKGNSQIRHQGGSKVRLTLFFPLH